MGSIRTLLAISVLFYHAYGEVLVGGSLAVQLFFMISGFLISFVLTEARTYGTVRAFYANRALRLFPLYYVVALCALVLHLGAHFAFGIDSPLVDVYKALDWDGRIALAVSNLTVFGQDAIMFTSVQDGNFHLSGWYWPTEVPVWKGLLIDPGWSLGVELLFYLVAPFVLPNRRLLLILLALSLMLRALFIIAGFGLQDPWLYRFFPTELALFLFGALSHQVWMPFLSSKGLLSRQSCILVTGAIFAYCTVFFLLPNQGSHHLLLFTLFIFALPFLFHFQRLFRFDRRIGDLSYPIYLLHTTVIYPVGFAYDRMTGQEGYNGLDRALVILALTLLGSILLHRFIEKRVELVRDGVRGRKKADVAPVVAPKAVPDRA